MKRKQSGTIFICEVAVMIVVMFILCRIFFKENAISADEMESDDITKENITSSIQNKILIGEKIMSADDIGLGNLMRETIVSVKYDSCIPNYIYESEDVSEIIPLLEIMEDSDFQLLAESPVDGCWAWHELLYIETLDEDYEVGVIDGWFFVKINDASNYYVCSGKDEFILKLLEIQGR